MAALWQSEETGSPIGEGACGKILETDETGVVMKQIHRRLKHRSKCLGAPGQCAMQRWAAELLTPENGFTLLFSPKAWITGSCDNRYFMVRIDCSDQVNPCALAFDEMTELRLFYQKAQAAGIWPCDYELYRQSDGRLGMIDFDKFSRWRQTPGGPEVVFPWGTILSNPVYPWSQ